MANLEEIVLRKTENDSQWKARQQADRENLMALQDAAVLEITSSPEAYSRYLDLQGDNPAYSAGNIALAMVQDGDVTVFGTKEKWKMLGRFVPVSESGNGIHIFARSTFGKGYTLADAYDVRQTQGRPMKEVKLENDTREMESTMATLLNYAACQVVIDKPLIAGGLPRLHTAQIGQLQVLIDSLKHRKRSPFKFAHVLDRVCLPALLGFGVVVLLQPLHSRQEPAVLEAAVLFIQCPSHFVPSLFCVISVFLQRRAGRPQDPSPICLFIAQRR